MGIEDELREIERLQKKGESTEARAAGKQQDIVNRIIKGESTGDPIRDFVIVSYGGRASKHAELPYKVLDHTVRKNIDEQILVVQQKEGIHGCPGIIAPKTIDPSFIGVDTTLYLGILTGPLEFKAGEGIVIPTKEYATQYTQGTWTLQGGSMTLSMFDLAGFGRTITKRRTPMRNDIDDLLNSNMFKSALHIYVGSEVEAYFRKDQRSLFKGDERLELSYVSALQLLGKNAPKDFKEAYDKKVYNERVSLISRIERATEPREEDSSESNRSREARVKRLLQEALTLGLHDCDMKFEYRTGVTIDVSVYVKALCKKYSIEPSEKYFVKSLWPFPS